MDGAAHLLKNTLADCERQLCLGACRVNSLVRKSTLRKVDLVTQTVLAELSVKSTSPQAFCTPPKTNLVGSGNSPTIENSQVRLLKTKAALRNAPLSYHAKVARVTSLSPKNNTIGRSSVGKKNELQVIL